MAQYLVIDSDGLVQNVVEWDGVSPWQPAPGCTVELLVEGEYYEFAKPRGIAPPEPPSSRKKKGR